MALPSYSFRSYLDRRKAKPRLDAGGYGNGFVPDDRGGLMPIQVLAYIQAQAREKHSARSTAARRNL